MKHKVSELEGEALALAVAMAIGYPTIDAIPDEMVGFDHNPCGAERLPWRPDRIWDQGGPLIEHKGITLDYNHDEHLDGDRAWRAPWFACANDYAAPIRGYRGVFKEKAHAFGKTPLVAGMRAIVGGEYGEEIELPEFGVGSCKDPTYIAAEKNERHVASLRGPGVREDC